MYREFLKEVGNFVFMENDPEKADIIFVPGNRYPQMAERAADLYKNGFAPLILPSGKYSITDEKFCGVLSEEHRYDGCYETEWDFLKSVLLKKGVPETAILKENQATYTWENARLSRIVTDQAGIKINKAIICCKTHHARRAYMYYQRAYPETEFLVCPCVVDGIEKTNWTETQQGIDAVTGEVSRIIHQFSLMMK